LGFYGLLRCLRYLLDLSCSRQCFSDSIARALKDFRPGLPDFSWSMIPKLEEMYHMNRKCTKWSNNIPDVRKIFPMAKNISIFPNLRPSKIYPNWDFWFRNKTIWRTCFRPVFGATLIVDFHFADRQIVDINVYTPKCRHRNVYIKKLTHPNTYDLT
jgi:hypothetical protein